jgi:hypothetical protein
MTTPKKGGAQQSRTKLMGGSQAKRKLGEPLTPKWKKQGGKKR